jgi:deoxyinosine 3'endonuclease (endonuclease V)
MDQLGIRDYPTSILVDGNGIIQYVHIGLLTKDTIERDIVPLLPKTDS